MKANFELRAKKFIFLGYLERVKGYKLWCQDGKSSKYIISRDVTFNEVEMPIDKELPNETKDNGFTKKVEPFYDAPIDQGEEKKEQHPAKVNTQELQHYNLS